MYINEQTFRCWWSVFRSDYPTTEIRLLGGGRSGKPASGYFRDVDKALAAILAYPSSGHGIYAPINEIAEKCFDRIQQDRIMEGVATTTDTDIAVRRWLLIDLDPERPSGINANDEEKKAAYHTMTQIGVFLRDQGFSSPVVVDSGNGYHLYYRINLTNEQSRTDIVKNVLLVLDMLFSNDRCHVDVSVFNASRIAKIPGSVSNKGAEKSADRPRRESHFIRIPEDIEATDIAILEKVAAMLPEKEAPSRYNNYHPERFDMDGFLTKYGIEVARRTEYSGGMKLVLKQCPFDENHKAPDSAIFVARDGGIGFKCLHHSCSHYTWKDVRLHFDKDAYSSRDYDDYLRRRDYYDTRARSTPVVVPEDARRGKKWKTMSSVTWQDPANETYIPSGLGQLDTKMGGFALGDITILSGLSGAGKTSLINNFILSAMQRGYKVAVWSGELKDSRFKSWLNQAAAGRNFVKHGSGSVEYWYCPEDVSRKVDTWTEDKLWLYNNDYGNKISQILSDIRECIAENGTQFIIVDNLMALQLDAYIGDKNERQQGFINDLKDAAMASNVHILLVCHPRKEQLNTLLRMESIAGSSDLYNMAANVLLCHRVGSDFEKRAREFFGEDRVETYVNAGYNEVIEVAKNRSHGIKDHMFGLYYERETRRFKNSQAEYVIYGWQEEDMPPTLQIPDDPLGTYTGEAPF